MLVSRGRNPSAGEILTQLVQAKDLRNRVLITLGLLLLVRLGIYIPVPGIDRLAFQDFIARGGQLIGFLDIFTGGGISTLGVFGLGILPYINASIILQLLTASLPQLEDLQKNEGEAGRRKIAQYTRYVALGWGILQSVVFALILRPYATAGTSELVFVLQTAVALVTGSMVVMWISEVITERGIGQGASLVIYLNIVATLPRALGSTIELAQSGDRSTVGGIVVLVAVFLLTIVGIVCVEEGNRRIPIVSAKRQVGGASLSARQSYLPLKLNAGGVMPIIFASAVVFLPVTIANFTKSPWLIQVAAALSPTHHQPGGCGHQPQALRGGDPRRSPGLGHRQLPRGCAEPPHPAGGPVPRGGGDHPLSGGIRHPGENLPGLGRHQPADPGGRGHPNRQAAADRRDLAALRGHGAPVSAWHQTPIVSLLTP
ncbi:MAG: preprotein translocase subunit SecY [Cyanobacteriota bacterium]